MKIFRRILVSLFLWVPLIAFAQKSEDSELFSLEFIAPLINHVFGRDTVQIFINAALSIANGLNSFAMQLAGVLAILSIIWGVTVAVSSQKSALPVLIEVVLLSALTFLLLSNYSVIVNDLVAIGQKVIEVSGASIGDAFQDFINTLIKTFMITFNASIENRGSNFEWMKMLVDRVIALVLMIFAFIVLMLSVKDLIGVLILGPVSIGVGVAVGPILLAGIPNGYTRQLAERWVNFMISSAMITAMVVLVLVLMKNTIMEVFVQVVGQNPESAGTTGKIVALAILIASMQQVFNKIPDMVNQLFPGIGKVGGMIQGSKTASNMRSGSMTTASGLGRVAGAIPGVNKGVKAAAAAAKQGFQNGKNSRTDSGAQQAAQLFSKQTSKP